MIDEAVLDLMWRQSVLLSLGCLLLLGLRPLLLRYVGAPAAYASWLLIPLLLLTTTLPRPAQEPLRVVLQQSALPGLAKAATTAPATSDLNRQALFALWAAGALAVALTQWCRQRRFEALIDPHDGRLPAASSPALLGLWRARLVLPQDFEQRFDGDEQQLILAHEAVHLRRHDNAGNLMACALCALHWFNPLAWIAWRRMRADQELSCDAAVLRAHPRKTVVYARALVKTTPMTSRFAVTASSWHSHHHPLVERVAMLKLHTSRRVVGSRLSALFLAMCAGAAYALQADATSDQKVEITMTIHRGGQIIAKPRLITSLGAKTTVQVGSDASAWQIEMTTTQRADGQLETRSQVNEGLPLHPFATHTFIAPDGAPFHWDNSAVQGGSTLAFDRAIRLLK